MLAGINRETRSKIPELALQLVLSLEQGLLLDQKLDQLRQQGLSAAGTRNLTLNEINRQLTSTSNRLFLHQHVIINSSTLAFGFARGGGGIGVRPLDLRVFTTINTVIGNRYKIEVCPLIEVFV